MNKDDALRSCMRKVESDRRQLRGQPELIRKHYWLEVETMLAQVVDFAKNSGSDVSVGKASDVATFLLSVSRSASITSVGAKRPELLEFGLTALAMENMQEDYRETMIELYLLDHSASLLQESLAVVLDRNKNVYSQSFRDMCQGFLCLEGRTIESIRYVESTDRNGAFTYLQVR